VKYSQQHNHRNGILHAGTVSFLTAPKKIFEPPGKKMPKVGRESPRETEKGKAKSPA
jgi:hypothetical protein